VVGQGSFLYCDESADCSGGAFPDSVAVGATFFAWFSPDSGSDGATIESAQPARLRAIGESRGETQFRALGAGAALLQARTTSSHRLVDSVDVTLTEIVAIVVGASPALERRDGGRASVTIPSGGSRTPSLCATPLDASGGALGGALGWDWSTSDSGVARLSAGAESRCRTLVPVGAGTASVAVSVGDVHGEIDVVVTP
jgi:hypothetical protein